MANWQDPMSHSENSVYEPRQPYQTNRMPQPVRLAIPPPDLEYDNNEPRFMVLNVPSFNYDSNEYGNPIFLQSIANLGTLRLAHTMLEWEYGNRRSAQSILPFLFLGSISAAKDIPFIRDNGITLIMAVRSAATVRAHSRLMDPSRFQSSAGIETLALDLDDPYDLITKLPKALKTMNDHLEHTCSTIPITSMSDIRGKILVFCESGNERSATVVTAYLMVLYSLDVVTALQAVQSQRFCVAPGDDMKNMLQSFGDILQAKRDVAKSSRDTESVGILGLKVKDMELGGVTLGKRSSDQVYENDVTMDAVYEVDDGIGGRRIGAAPFADAI